MNRPGHISQKAIVSLLVLAMVGATQAASLFPLHVGQVLEFTRYDTHNPTGWTMTLQIDGQATFDMLEYFHVLSWNYDNDSQLEDHGYMRSTEQALYRYNPSGDDTVMFQRGSVGTKWSVPESDGAYNYDVTEIVAIEAVTVPYGTFSEAYTYRKYSCVDPNNLALGQSPSWYEWVVPGIGMVKEEDWWTDYPPAIQELTGLTVAPVYRFWSPQNSRHFYTVSEAEKNYVIATYPPSVWTYETVAYYAFAEDTEPGVAPVYRFWSNSLSAHFYTISEAERDYVIDNLAAWSYEGPVFYAFPAGSQPTGASPVYRFWSETLSTHFYTINEAEKDYVIDNLPAWEYETIAWYAYE